MAPSDEDIRRILETYKRIAVYGISRHRGKAAHDVPAFLSKQGYRIIPINPHAAKINGKTSYRSLKDIPGRIDILEVFRPSDQVLDVVKEAVARRKGQGDIAVVWLQQGIRNEKARKLAESAGMIFIQDRCMKVTLQTLIGQGKTMILAGDIGGTKTTLAFFSPGTGPRKPVGMETFSSERYPGLEDIVGPYMAKANVAIEKAVFGVAGPVVNGRARITNLPWVIEEKTLRRTLKIPSLHLINDLEAIAGALPILKPEDRQTLHRGSAAKSGTIAVIAPGTGLGEAFLVGGTQPSKRDDRPQASEGGHADYAPKDPLEWELLSHLRKRYSHVSYERVCSGPGIQNIYAFLKENGYGREPVWLRDELARAEDPTTVIVNAALRRTPPCEICRRVLHIFTSILGAEAGNLALKVLATGGIYLGGGIPPAILPVLRTGPFMTSFRDKGRMSDLLSRIPVHVIMNPRATLFGAARLGLEKV